MLAAATTTGDWIVGGIALVVGLGIIVGIFWLLYRLVTWPVRARRRRRNTGGLGSDYERMVRQQRRSQPPTEGRRLPYPPPGGWQSSGAPQPATSQVVLPAPPYRTREPEAPEPEAEPTPTVLAKPQAVAAPAASSTWGRLMRTPIRIPAWVILPLAWLGTLFLLAFQLWGGWAGYVIGLLFAVALGLTTKRRYHSRVLWRAEHNAVVWVRTGKRDDTLSPPVIVTPVTENLPGSTQTPTQTQPDTSAP